MKKLFCAASALLAVLAAPSVHAGGIVDAGAKAFWGADGNVDGAFDVFGDSKYEIEGATIVRVGTVLTITIFTEFAGHAGLDPNIAAKGVGYGDVFLSSTWSPNGTDQHHIKDKATNSTKWSYGLGLGDARWNNAGGEFTLYKLVGSSNAANIKNSDSFISNCNANQGCQYRNGQEVAVKTENNASNVKNTGVKGNFTVDFGKQLTFTIDVAGTDLMNFNNFAMHWGETSQNDVVEGITQAAPEPESIALLMLGLGGLAVMRRRRARK